MSVEKCHFSLHFITYIHTYLRGRFTASLKPKWVSVKVPRKGALNIEMTMFGG